MNYVPQRPSNILMAKSRLTKRTHTRILHHSALMASTIIMSAVLISADIQTGAIAKLSIATAYASTCFFVIALGIGPIKVLTGRNSPVSQDFRRDIGIWSGILAIVHSVAGLQVHFSGRMHLYFVFPQEEQHLLPIRHDFFGIANYSGLFATVLFCYLLYLSNDASVRRLGLDRWKARQRLTYLIAFLLALHGLVYQQLEDRNTYLIFTFVAFLTVAAVAQLSGFIGQRRK